MEGEISVIAAACNHRNRVGNLKTRGSEIGASCPPDPIEKALRNFPAESSTQELSSTSIGCRGEGSIYAPAWRQSTDRLRPSPTALRALGEDTSAAVDEWNVSVRIIEEVRRSRTGRQGHKNPKR